MENVFALSQTWTALVGFASLLGSHLTRGRINSVDASCRLQRRCREILPSWKSPALSETASCAKAPTIVIVLL